jgi:hypothetical protein
MMAFELDKANSKVCASDINGEVSENVLVMIKQEL